MKQPTHLLQDLSPPLTNALARDPQARSHVRDVEIESGTARALERLTRALVSTTAAVAAIRSALEAGGASYEVYAQALRDHVYLLDAAEGLIRDVAAVADLGVARDQVRATTPTPT